MKTTSDDHPGTAFSVFHVQSDSLEANDVHAHAEHTVAFLAAGTLRMAHGTTLSVPAGTALVIPAGVPHQLLGGSRLDIWGVSFCGACFQLTESRPLMRIFGLVRRGIFPAFEIPAERRGRVMQLFSFLEQDQQDTTEHSWELSRCVLLLLLGELARASSVALVDRPPESLVAAALGFIEAHCLEPISLADVARAVGRTPAHVTTSVKKATGSTVGQWIATARVSEASRRLVHTDDSLEVIANHVGWQDPTHLIRQFKKAHGVTPGLWRRRSRADHRAGRATSDAET